MEQENLKDAIRIVLFLAIIHRPATVCEIASAIERPEACITDALYQLNAANIVFHIPHRRRLYELQERSVPVTLEEVAQAMEKRKKSFLVRPRKVSDNV